MSSTKKPTWSIALGLLALLFGTATLVEGGHTLALPAAQRPAGVVLWVLGFNFLAGFFYLAAGLGLLLRRRWAVTLAWAIAVSTALIFAAFLIHVAMGGAFMPRTVAAMTLRSGFWFSVAWMSARNN